VGLVILGSAKGSPGVTTTAVVLARCWPESAVVVECDCYGGDLAARYGLSPTPGLVGWASIQEVSESWVIARQSLPGGGGAIVGSVGDWEAMAAVEWGRLAAAMAAADELMLADVGRLGVGCFEALGPKARAVVLVVRRELSAISHLRGVLGWVRQLACGVPIGVVVVGEKGLWSDGEVAASLGVEVLGSLPWVDDLARPPRRAGIPDLGPLGRSGAHLCERLAEMMGQSRPSAPDPGWRGPAAAPEHPAPSFVTNNPAARAPRILRKEHIC
jgi:hypothetical protein